MIYFKWGSLELVLSIGPIRLIALISGLIHIISWFT